MASVATFVAVKAGFVAALAAVVGAFPLAKLTAFDAGWYLTVINGGYHLEERSNLAFFPLLPLLAKLPMAFGLSPQWALLTVAWVGSVVAVLGIHRVGTELGSPAVGFWLAFCWAVAPRAHVQAMGYAEGWFTAFIAWGLWAMVTNRHLLAGAMGLLAGLTRAPSLVYVAVLGLWWLVGVLQHQRARDPSERWQLDRLAAALLGSMGFIAFWSYIAYRTGSFWGYLDVQEGWNSLTGSPATHLIKLWQVVTGGLEGATWDEHGTSSIALVLVIVLVVIMIVSREHWLATSMVVLALLLTLVQQEYYHSKARMLMPWFMVWLPVARWLARQALWAAAVIGLVLAAVSIWWGVDGALYRYSP